ncbi:hypothetical protein BS333_03910 [Vibrio azureus]|uniref:Uncharacterized protein n=1 Tax=Vibrio azureus NBRC 104587 TaxID=1219077 RepID=U3AVY1_9VIBR|nr:hypothetical protein [Vibrio azureus]AUI85580.1 hypothetical protein BS333_03910 [Vibrio azureus]GAD77382.1 hypothetical protein VAZ01S_073_00150 [Vibrio azureus NBRC 104587]
MNLKYPETDIDFNPDPSFFIGAFDIYDQEETLGEYLNQFDPNDTEQLCFILEKEFFSVSLDLTVEHHDVLMRMLASALKDVDHDFSAYIYIEDDEYFFLPFAWEIKSPRRFFEVIYLKAYMNWSDQLMAEGLEVTKPEELF